MKRPGYDLRWQSIRRCWPSTINKQESINQNDPSPSTCTTNFDQHVKRINEQTCLFTVDLAQLTSNSAKDRTHNSSCHPSSSDQNECLSRSNVTEMNCSELRTIISQISHVINYIKQQEKHDNESQDWKFVAMVIDRLCLILFTVSMAIFTSLTLLSAPNFFALR
jgi:hypothetical protein